MSMSTPPSSPRPTTLTMVSSSPAAFSPAIRNMPTPTKAFDTSDGNEPFQGTAITPFMNLVTPSASTSRPSATRRVRSDERDNRTKRPMQSYGSPLRHPKRRAMEGGRSTASIRSTTDVNYPTLGNAKTAQAVHEEVRRRLFMPTSKSNKSGFVYIVRDPARPDLLKIGSSANTGQRWKKIEKECGVKVEEIFVSPEVDNCLRTERLAQADVWHLCRPHKCVKCSTTHHEWHEIGEDLAIDTVKRWVNFMQRQPYTSAGTLKPIWKHLLDRRRFPQPLNGVLDHEIRWQHWDSVLLPPRQLDYCGHLFETCLSWWRWLWMFSWQISTVLSWAVLFLTFRNITSLFFLFVSVLCSSAHVSASKLSQRARKR